MSALLLAFVLLGAAPAAAQDPVDTEPLQGHIIAVSGDHFDIVVDVGNGALKGDDIGVIRRGGVEIGLATVVFVDIGRTSMRIISKTLTRELQTGDLVVFDQTRTASGPLPQPEFVPLLSPPRMPKTALARTSSVFHGRARAWQLHQTIRPSGASYRVSRLDLDGSIDRIGGRPWSLTWSGNVRYRDGSSPSTSDDYRRAKPHVYRLALSRKLDGGGSVRLGRLLPLELPGAGYFDGLQAEGVPASWLRLGAAAGSRPERATQEPSSRELAGALYATAEAGAPRGTYYSGTLGALHTRWRGRPDELALLLDQRADLGARLSLVSSSQLDFAAGGAAVRSGARLTRQDLSARAEAGDQASVTAGAGHYEPLDLAAERALTGGATDYLNDGYWRYWTGASRSLPLGLRADGQVSWTRARGRFAPGLWRASLTRVGLPALPSGFASLTVYNLYNPSGPDHGATLAFSAPLFDARLIVDADLGLRRGPSSGGATRSSVSDLGLRAAWRFAPGWTAEAGAARSQQSELKTMTYTGGLAWRW